MLQRGTRPRFHMTIIGVKTGVSLSLALLLCLILFSSPLYASAHTTRHTANTHADGPTLSVSAAFNGRFRDNNWIPVYISLSNNGTDFTGSVAVDIPTPYANVGNSDPISIYKTPVTLATGAQKQITMYVPLYFGAPGSQETLAVHLLDSNGQRVSTQNTALRTLGNNDLFVGLLSDQSSGFSPLNGVTLPNQTASLFIEPLSAATFSTQTEVLKNFDLIVLDNFTTSSLSHEQLTALHSWVNQGGALIEVGGPEWRHTLSPLPADLLPVTVTGTQNIAAGTPLLPIGGPTKSGPQQGNVTDSVQALVAISTATVTDKGSTILASGTTPLIVQSQFGQGSLCYVAFDPTLDPIVSWPSATRLWQGLLLRTIGDQMVTPGPTANYYSNSKFSTVNTDGLINIIQSLLPNSLPSIVFILLLLLSYVLVLGPIRFLIVRRLKKRDWSWRITLATIVVFTLLSYGLALQQKGTSVISSTVSVIQLSLPNTTTGATSTMAHTTTYLGVFVPSQGDFHVHIDGNSLIQPSDIQSYGRGNSSSPQLTTITPASDSTNVDLQSVNIWTLHTITSQRDQQVKGGLISHLTFQDDILTGTVTNTLPYALSDAYVLMAYRYVAIGHIGVGESKQVTLSLNLKAGDPGTSLADQIANSNGLPPQYGSYYNGGQQPQTDKERHVAMLTTLSGESGAYYCGNGPCYQPLYLKSAVYTNTGVTVLSGSGPPAPATHDPLLLPNATATLIGWADKETGITGNVTINGNSSSGVHETFVQAPLDVTYAGNISLPSNFIMGQIVDVQGPSSDIQQQFPDVYTLGTGSMTFEFTLPTTPHLHVTSATVVESSNLTQILQSTGAMGSLPKGVTDVNQARVSLYNWQTHTWDNTSISSFLAPISNIDVYVGTGGHLLVQFAHTASSQGAIVLNKPELQLQGTA